jgi:hypothetical protein
MSIAINLDKIDPGKTRRLPFLPRFGWVLEWNHHQLSYRQTPFLETLVNLRERGFSYENLLKVSLAEVKEIQFPKTRLQKIAALAKGKVGRALTKP